MNEEARKLEDCLAEMKKCLKVPHVERCVCFSDALKVLSLEADRLQDAAAKAEIEKIRKNISSGDKECLGCDPCRAAVVFKAYPDALNKLYTDNEL